MSYPSKAAVASSAPRLRVLAAAEYACKALRHHRTATVVAVFERSLYLALGGGLEGTRNESSAMELGIFPPIPNPSLARGGREYCVSARAGRPREREFVCVGVRGIGLGPLNVLLRVEDWARLRATPVGQSVAIGQDALAFDNDAVIALGGVPTWRPRSIAVGASPTAVRARLSDLATLVFPHAPPQSLIALAFPSAGQTDDNVLLGAARPGWTALGCWLGAALRQDEKLQFTEPIGELLGLGIGLTPSGDDLLGGVLIALRMIGHERVAERLWQWLRLHTDLRTSELSAAHLAAAAQGQGHYALHAVLQNLLSGEPLQLRTLLDLGEVGHCSGWDALAGVVLVLRALFQEEAAANAAASSVA